MNKRNPLLTFLVIYLVVTMVLSSHAQSNYGITILRVDNYTTLFNESGTTVVFNATLEVENNSSANITIAHPDSCGFKLDVVYHDGDNWENKFPLGCFQAITYEEFKPGTTETHATGGILFDEALTTPPDGDYTLELVTHGEIDASQVKNLDITIIGGAIQPQDGIERNINFNSLWIPLAIISMYISMKLVIGISNRKKQNE